MGSESWERGVDGADGRDGNFHFLSFFTFQIETFTFFVCSLTSLNKDIGIEKKGKKVSLYCSYSSERGQNLISVSSGDGDHKVHQLPF